MCMYPSNQNCPKRLKYLILVQLRNLDPGYSPNRHYDNKYGPKGIKLVLAKQQADYNWLIDLTFP